MLDKGSQSYGMQRIKDGDEVANQVYINVGWPNQRVDVNPSLFFKSWIKF